MKTSDAADARDDFYLSSGGRVYQLIKRLDARQQGAARITLRVVALLLIGWLPLLLLSLIQGLAFGHLVTEPLLKDLETNIRFLIVVPLLIIAEIVVDPKLAGVLKQFVSADLMAPAATPHFESALKGAKRLRDSEWFEAALLLIAFLASYQAVKFGLHDGRSSWLGINSDTGTHLTLAGWWYGLVSGPIQRFLLYRWLWRLLIWSGLLWRISRLDLVLMPTHPDRAGGLGFFGYGQVSFSIVILAASTIASAHVGERIIWQGASLTSYKALLIGFVILCLLLILGPLLVFSWKLWETKVRGLQEYGVLGQKYTRSFDQKWVRGEASEDEPLLGSSDIQSLADLGNSYEIISDMKMVPLNPRIALVLVVSAIAPMLPLLLFQFSLEDLLLKILKMLT